MPCRDCLPKTLRAIAILFEFCRPFKAESLPSTLIAQSRRSIRRLSWTLNANQITNFATLCFGNYFQDRSFLNTRRKAALAFQHQGVWRIRGETRRFRKRRRVFGEDRSEAGSANL